MKKLLWENQKCDGVEKHVPKSWANAGVLLMGHPERVCSRKWFLTLIQIRFSTKKF